MSTSFKKWLNEAYPDREDRQGKFRMSSVSDLMQAAFDAGLTINADKLDAYRAEIEDSKRRIGKLVAKFIELEAFEDAARCAIKADGMKFVLGRIPPPERPSVKPSTTAGERP